MPLHSRITHVILDSFMYSFQALVSSRPVWKYSVHRCFYVPLTKLLVYPKGFYFASSQYKQPLSLMDFGGKNKYFTVIDFSVKTTWQNESSSNANSYRVWDISGNINDKIIIIIRSLNHFSTHCFFSSALFVTIENISVHNFYCFAFSQFNVCMYILMVVLLMSKCNY